MIDDPAGLTNGDLARIFHEIGDMLELKGELVFKTVAYHRAADAIGRSPVDIVSAYRAGTPPQIPGVGKAISDKLAELATTGHLAFYERLRAEVPPSLVELAPDPGPRAEDGPPAQRGARDRDRRRPSPGGRGGPAARAFAACRRGPRRSSSRGSPSSTIGSTGCSSAPAETLIDGLIDVLAPTPGVQSIEPAGSFRRRRESIGDLDLLAETDQPAALIDAFASFGLVDSVINRGGYKAAVRLMRGPQVDLMVMPPGEAGTYRIHFTGSKEHNVRLRAMARDQGWSLSEKGFLRIGEDGEPLTGADAELRTFATEAEAYAFLGLPFIEPELREDAGEIEAALAGRLPALIAQADLRGDLHSHSDWSDGHQPIEVMTEAARRRGYAYQVLTDHTQSLAIARGLTPDRVAEQAEVIAALNARFAAEEAAGTAPPETPAEGFRLLHGCELEVRADGRLDFEDDLLARFDLVVASVHVVASPDAGGADEADAQRDPQPARRRHRPPVRAQDRAARRPRPRLGRRLQRSRPDRHGARDERLAAAARPCRRAGSPGGRPSAACWPSIRTRTTSTSSTSSAGGSARRAAPGSRPDVVVNTRPRADLLAWAGRQAGARVSASRTIAAMDDRSARRDLALVAVTVVGLSRLLEPPLVWVVAAALLGAMLFGTLQVLADEAAPGQAWFGVAIESLILPSVAAVACLGAIRLVPFGLWLAPALGLTWLVVIRTLSLEARITHGSAGLAEDDRTALLVTILLVAFLGFTGVAAMVPGGLVQTAGAIDESNLLVLAAGDALVAGLLGYRAVALRVTNVREALGPGPDLRGGDRDRGRRHPGDGDPASRRPGAADPRVLPVGRVRRLGPDAPARSTLDQPDRGAGRPRDRRRAVEPAAALRVGLRARPRRAAPPARHRTVV